jgi:hypothetical protein
MLRTLVSDDKHLRTLYSANAVRPSIGFPPDLCETLEEIVQERKLSLACGRFTTT